MLPAVQQIEICDAHRIAHHGLTINRRVLRRQGEHGLADQRIALGPIISAPSKYPHATGAPADDQPLAIVFDLVNPQWADRRLGRKRRNAGIDKALRAATSRLTTP
jgi:hypothetical protein